MTLKTPAPAVALFLEGTSRSVEALQKIVSGLQRAGRRVYVFPGSGVRAPDAGRGHASKKGEPPRL